MTHNETILRKATFNEAVKTYIFIVVAFYLLVSVIGIVLLPFWFFGLGQWLSGKFFKTLECEIGSRNLRFSKGLIIHIEKTIPLENIQDLSFIGGPLLRAFSLSLIRVETAGGSNGHNSNRMSILGINDAESFKKEILSQREKVIAEKFRMTGAAPVANDLSDKLLMDIKNELVEIKDELRKQNQN